MEQTKALLKVALRQQALYIPTLQRPCTYQTVDEESIYFVAELVSQGYHVSEELLYAIPLLSAEERELALKNIQEALGLGKGWTPLIRNWKTPVNVKSEDYVMTFFANFFMTGDEVTLPCGHYIPEGTFPLERYNGCPYCSKPFRFEELTLKNQARKRTILQCWTLDDVMKYYNNLLQSKTPLDATQQDSLKTLISYFPLPDAKPAMKETLMLVIDILLERNEPGKAQQFFNSPGEILRYLWYKHTGFVQIISPNTILKRYSRNHEHFRQAHNTSAIARVFSKAFLELRYGRKTGRMVAEWLNAMPQTAEKMCEDMHPKRGMWVRYIRALRLSEFSRRPGFEKLRELLDVFYNERYEVYNGQVQHFRLKKDATATLSLLQQRPGLFARSLFANMLWFGEEPVLNAFAKVINKVPARLVFTLNMYAEDYFTKNNYRTVKPLGGVAKVIAPNRLLQLFSIEELAHMKDGVQELTLTLMKGRFAGMPNNNKTIFIDPLLFKMPLSIGDRSDSIQDLPVALQGTRFPVEGNTVRLFMQWGTGLPAQHLDMDLSCMITYDKVVDHCSFSNMYPVGCQHSGDITTIPDQVGTAEYIDIDLEVLSKENARYVTFVCNAYSNGSMSPNMVIGWMDSANEMEITDEGVAYDPSCVQHQVRIGKGLTKGMVFGVLEIASREIIWLEMPFQGQVVGQMNFKMVQTLLRKLESKLSVGNLLRIKAEAQALEEVAHPSMADEAYTAIWAKDAAAVTQLFID
ncbi:hypothetical protein [Chitinophaga silvisoli]|uniref:Prokaryotic RING finger family 4 n=1 Tax=Chitinophaga silvisoli TaxID=2291814 RepID=A0A3E1NWR3_9BACT|nr:hypothetical protein [Chitinophaga silvisoli]RFM32208.1 hypothetical protein DXN04_25870 [Chitinophaga silvisoli]